jgi:hypothetical protein
LILLRQNNTQQLRRLFKSTSHSTLIGCNTAHTVRGEKCTGVHFLSSVIPAARMAIISGVARGLGVLEPPLWKKEFFDQKKIHAILLSSLLPKLPIEFFQFDDILMIGLLKKFKGISQVCQGFEIV